MRGTYQFLLAIGYSALFHEKKNLSFKAIVFANIFNTATEQIPNRT